MSKTNPGGFKLSLWTTDEYWPLEPEETAETKPADPPQPTPLAFAAVILKAIRPFPDAYQAMLCALDAFWPAPLLDTT